ncbi:MAG: hypothetical protein J6V01_01830, partial [Clostridia bacterium]|nr:hypothetical protein [Clostridia bacterium]
RITVAVCAVAIMLSSAVFPPVSVSALTIPTDESVYERISTIYRDALEFNYQRSGQRASNFTGYCSHYVHLQLMMLGVNTSYVGVNGNGAYNVYENLSYSTGGKKIHAYPSSGTNPIARILRTISSACPVATNIMLGFHSTSTASGKKYGHAMLIHAIINGYVYFTDNFAMRVGGTYYNQGDPIKCTIAEFDAFYGRPSVFSFEGIIWFETEELTAAVLSGNTSSDPVPDDTAPEQTTSSTQTEVQPTDYTPGIYTVNYAAGLRIRSQSTTNSSTLEVIPDRFRVYVTEVENGFGKIFCNYNGKNYSGWVYLGLTNRVGDLPVICADTYNSSGTLVAREWFESLEDAMENAAATAKLILVGDCRISSNVEVGPLREIRLGGFNLIPSSGAKLLIRGGTVTASSRNSFIESDPLLQRTSIAGGFSYTCPYTVSLSSTSISIGNNPEIVFMGETNAPSAGVEYLIECEGFNGQTRTFSGTLSNGRLRFKTDGIPAKRFADSFSVRAIVRSQTDHSYYIASE